MADKKEDDEGGKEHEDIFGTLQDERNRDLLHRVMDPLIDSVLTSKLSDIENTIKRGFVLELSDTVESLVEQKIKDVGVTMKRKLVSENVEDVENSNTGPASKKSKCLEEHESSIYEREDNAADEVIAHWQQMANNEWEKALAELHPNKNNRDELVALVTFGKETKVQRRLTGDYDGLKSEFEKLKPEGPSPMFGGLVLSKAVAKTTDCIAWLNSQTRILPKIIMITDGKPTDIKIINGPERTEFEDVRQTLEVIEEEAKSLTERGIELQIVYVGNPDYVFLHSLRESTGGRMMTCKEARKMALDVHVDAFLAHLRLKKEGSTSEERLGSETPELLLSKTFQKLHEELIKELEKLPSSLSELMENLEKKRKNILNKYFVVKDKRSKYPRIGSRVRRAKDWKWGDQDGNGPGTIIGHCYKVDTEDRQIQVWVEWDEDERQNVYRYKTNRSTKADVKIVEEERVPPEDEVLAVGMKVGIGPDYSGEQKPRQGVVIRISDEDDDKSSEDDGSSDVTKAEVLWEDEERGVYQFGDKGSKVEIQPRIQYTKPKKPQNVKVVAISDKEVCLKWERPASFGGCSIKKYIVYKKSGKSDSKWVFALEVENSETKATVADLDPNETYKFAVVAENRIGPGDMMETADDVKLKVSICNPEPPAGPLNIKNVTKSSCTVVWKKSPVCDKKPVKHYIIEIREVGKSGWKRINAESDTVYKVTQLRKSTPYELQVKSVNDNGVSEPLGIESFVTKKFLDSDIPHVTLQNSHLVQLSTALGGDWQLLGHYFHLTNVEIDHIVMQNKSSGVPMLIFKMLSVWIQRNPDSATFYKLIEGIEAVNAVTPDWDKIADVARKINETV